MRVMFSCNYDVRARVSEIGVTKKKKERLSVYDVINAIYSCSISIFSHPPL